MSWARGKEVYIITAVIVVVVTVAWFFLLYNPQRSQVSSLKDQIGAAETQLNGLQQDVVRLKSYAKTAPQTQADLLLLNKMMPTQTGIPSVIIELTQTAEQSGLDFTHLSPGAVTAGNTFSVQPITLTFTGGYFDLEDFLFRLESFVEYRNSEFLVTGRMLQVSQMQITPVGGAETSAATNDLTINLTLNSFMWSAEQVVQPALPNVIPAGTSTPLPSASPSTMPTGSSAPSVTPTGSPSS